jgi:hypothetical protein
MTSVCDPGFVRVVRHSSRHGFLFSAADIHLACVLHDVQLHTLVLSASSAALVTEPSEEQKERVKRFQLLEKARRRQMKDQRGAVKRNRGAGKGGGWD